MDSQTKGISPVAAGITGIILGIAGTVAVALTDDKTRDRATKKAHDLKDDLIKWSDNTVHEMQKKSIEVRKDLASKIDPNSKTPKVHEKQAGHTKPEDEELLAN